MNSQTILSALLALAAWLTLGACGDTPSAPEALDETLAAGTISSRTGEVIAEYREPIHPDLPPYRFTLTGAKPEPDSAPARVRAIEIRRGDEAQPFQVIGGIEAETPIERPGAFEFLDMNFDGYHDMRLIESTPAGPNVPYRNWLFDPAGGKFAASPELDGITSPEFDSNAKTVRSGWRDGPARYGEDTYRYLQEKPILVRREERHYSAPGVYRLTISERADGEMQVIESKEIRE